MEKSLNFIPNFQYEPCVRTKSDMFDIFLLRELKISSCMCGRRESLAQVDFEISQ